MFGTVGTHWSRCGRRTSIDWRVQLSLLLTYWSPTLTIDTTLVDWLIEWFRTVLLLIDRVPHYSTLDSLWYYRMVYCCDSALNWWLEASVMLGSASVMIVIVFYWMMDTVFHCACVDLLFAMNAEVQAILDRRASPQRCELVYSEFRWIELNTLNWTHVVQFLVWIMAKYLPHDNILW